MKSKELAPFKGDILTIDPAGGENTLGYFLYKHFSNYEINHYKGDKGGKWTKQIRNIEIITQKNNIKIIGVETGKLFLNQKYGYQMLEVIKVVGGIEDLAEKEGIEYMEISNVSVNNHSKRAEEGEIPGLEKVKELENSRWKVFWKFKGKKLNEHEKDAIIIFYILWKRLKRAWPWID